MVTLSSSSFNGGEISELMKSRPDHPKYISGCEILKNMVCIAQGSATRRPGMPYIALAKDQVLTNPVRIMPFVFSSTQSLQLEVGVGYVRFFKDKAPVLSAAVPYEVATTYTADDIPSLWIYQSNDVVFIASKNHPPAKLSRFADDNWTLEDIEFMPEVQTPVGVAVTNTTAAATTGKTTNKYRVTAIDSTSGEESQPSLVVSKTSSTLSQTTGNYNTITWTGNTIEPLEYRVYKNEAGIFGYIGSVPGADPETFRDDNIDADASDAPPNADNPFDATDEYPGIVFGWEQRLGWANSNNNPFNVWLSPSAQFESMSAAVPPEADDALTKTLAASSANGIQWIGKDRTLVVATTGNEWSLGSTDGDAISTSSGFTPQGEVGSENIPPLYSSGSLLYVQRGGDVVREFVYTYSSDNYSSNDASIISSHLLDGKKIKEWCVQLKPFSVVWMCLEDGGLVGMTHMREHEVLGWHSHETDGTIESICSCPGTGYDEVYFVTVREIDGVDTRMIECFGDYFIRQDEQEDAFFVDCGVTYDGVATELAVGIAPHLVGETVEVWGDGAQLDDQVVGVGGDVIFNKSVSKAHIGKGFVSDLRPTRPEIQTTTGVTTGKPLKVSHGLIRVYKTMSIMSGANEENLYEALKHDASDPLQPLFKTGIVPVVIDTGYTEEWKFLIRSNGPGPMTISSVIYSGELGDGI